jgi:hypothetical protein
VIWSLITAVLLSSGIGLAALYLTVKSQERWREGQVAEAMRFSNLSKYLNIVGVAYGLLVVAILVIYVAFQAALLMMAAVKDLQG